MLVSLASSRDVHTVPSIAMYTIWIPWYVFLWCFYFILKVKRRHWSPLEDYLASFANIVLISLAFGAILSIVSSDEMYDFNAPTFCKPFNNAIPASSVSFVNEMFANQIPFGLTESPST